VLVLGDEELERAQERLFRQLGHRHPAAADVEPGRVGPRAEHHDRTGTLPVGLKPLEELLAVVEHRRGRVERERAVRLELAIVPAALRRPAQRDHVIGEDLTEPRRLQNPRAVGGWHSRLGGVDLELDLGFEACGHRRSGPFGAIYDCIVLWRQVSFWLCRRLPARACHRCCHSFTDGTLAHVAGADAISLSGKPAPRPRASADIGGYGGRPREIWLGCAADPMAVLPSGAQPSRLLAWRRRRRSRWWSAPPTGPPGPARRRRPPARSSPPPRTGRGARRASPRTGSPRSGRPWTARRCPARCRAPARTSTGPCARG